MFIFQNLTQYIYTKSRAVGFWSTKEIYTCINTIPIGLSIYDHDKRKITTNHQGYHKYKYFNHNHIKNTKRVGFIYENVNHDYKIHICDEHDLKDQTINRTLHVYNMQIHITIPK